MNRAVEHWPGTKRQKEERLVARDTQSPIICITKGKKEKEKKKSGWTKFCRTNRHPFSPPLSLGSFRCNKVSFSQNKSASYHRAKRQASTAIQNSIHSKPARHLQAYQQDSHRLNPHSPFYIHTISPVSGNINLHYSKVRTTQSAAPSQFSKVQRLHPVQPGYVRRRPVIPIAGIHSLFLWPLVCRGPQSHSQAPSVPTGDQRQSPTPALWVQAPVSAQLKTQGQPLGTEPTFSIHTTHQTTSTPGMFLWSMFCKKCESARSLLTKI